tara:strand:- start:24594 stop:25529 length:936 start_codon:yes stop_codon:yes gene_type:complete
MPSPFEDPSFSTSDFDLGDTGLTWKTGNQRKRRGMGPLPILFLGGLLCLGIVVTFIKASRSAARNDSHLAKIEKPEVKVEPNHSAYIPTVPRELPTTIVLPSVEDSPPTDSQFEPNAEPPEIARTEPEPLPQPPEIPPISEEPAPEEPPEVASIPERPQEPAVASVEPADPRMQPPLPIPQDRPIPRQRRIGEARFALLIPVAQDPVFLSTRQISTSYFRPYASAKSRAMVPGSYARVTKDEAMDFANWLTQVHRAKGLIGRSEYYRLPAQHENRSNDSWQSDDRGGSSAERRVFRLALVATRSTERPFSG